MHVFLGIVLVFFTVVGIMAIAWGIYDNVMSEKRRWKAHISLNITLFDDELPDMLIQTANYVRDRYMPNLDIYISRENLSEENKKIAEMLVEDSNTDIID